MGAFEYIALDNTGREKKGVLEGDSARQIRQQLREQKLIPLSVDEVADRAGEGKGRFGGRASISASDLALITRQLATLSRSGLPLDEATATVAKQCEKQKLKRLILGVRAKVVEGHALAEGMAQFPGVFNDLYRSTVKAGEQSGHLDLVLERLADYTEARQQLQNRIRIALLYPSILTVMAIAIVSFLLAYVVPKIVGVFETSGQTLPWITTALIGVSDFFVDNYILIILALAAAIGVYSAFYRQPVARERIHRFWLKLPVIGRFVRGANTARFARTLSILVGAGVPLLEALRIAGEVVSNLPMRHAILDAAQKVREGASLARALDQSQLFPPIVINLIASGEVSGNLEDMLERSSVNQERELETNISTVMGLFEPLIILVMGVVVLIIVLAILLPIFNMNDLIK